MLFCQAHPGIKDWGLSQVGKFGWGPKSRVIRYEKKQHITAGTLDESHDDLLGFREIGRNSKQNKLKSGFQASYQKSLFQPESHSLLHRGSKLYCDFYALFSCTSAATFQKHYLALTKLWKQKSQGLWMPTHEHRKLWSEFPVPHMPVQDVYCCCCFLFGFFFLNQRSVWILWYSSVTIKKLQRETRFLIFSSWVDLLLRMCGVYKLYTFMISSLLHSPQRKLHFQWKIYIRKTMQLGIFLPVCLSTAYV